VFNFFYLHVTCAFALTADKMDTINWRFQFTLISSTLTSSGLDNATKHAIYNVERTRIKVNMVLLIEMISLQVKRLNTVFESRIKNNLSTFLYFINIELNKRRLIVVKNRNYMFPDWSRGMLLIKKVILINVLIFR